MILAFISCYLSLMRYINLLMRGLKLDASISKTFDIAFDISKAFDKVIISGLHKEYFHFHREEELYF